MSSLRPSTAQRVLERQRSMVRMAAEEGLGNLVVFALDGARPDQASQLAAGTSPQNVPLVTACLKGHLEVVKNLVEKCKAPLDCRADITIVNEHIVGAFPLWAASANGHLNCVRYLVEKSADVNGKTPSGSVPLRVATYEGHVEVVKYLLQKGGDVNSCNQKGVSVLMVACAKQPKNLDLVNLLLINGADISHVNPMNGHTALHEACLTESKELVSLLIKKGATMTTDHCGDSPLLFAALGGHEGVVNVLLEVSDFSRNEKADALEVLGTTLWMDDDLDHCLTVWRRALDERHCADKPVVYKQEPQDKVAAFGYETEIQTREDLRKLQKARDHQQLGVQSMLIRERVFGKAHEETTRIIKYNAAVHFDNKRVKQSIDLLIYGAESLSGVFPFTRQVRQLNVLMLDLLISGFENEEWESKPTYEQMLKCFTLALSQFKRGEQHEANTHTVDILRERHVLLKVLLHMIVLLIDHVNLASKAQQEQITSAVRELVKMGVRSQKGFTLLHMACDPNTSKVDPDYKNQGRTYTFPCFLAVKILLQAGCDVKSRNDAGETALQFIQGQEGDHSEIIALLNKA